LSACSTTVHRAMQTSTTSGHNQASHGWMPQRIAKSRNEKNDSANAAIARNTVMTTAAA
jgi:hypothetical protein